MTKVPKLIVVFWDLVGAIKNRSYKKIGEQCSNSNNGEIKHSKKNFQFFLGEILLKFEKNSFSAAQNNKKKTIS